MVISEMKDFRREFAAKMGFDVVDPADPEFDYKLGMLGGKEGFDVSFEVAGVPATINTCLEYTKATGTVMVVAITNKPFEIPTSKIFSKELTVAGVRIHNLNNFKGAIEMLQVPEIARDVKQLIGRVYPLEEINEAFEYAEHGEDSFKVLVKI